jgi:transcriptional regulator with XRE-family HTH domain
MPHITGNQMRAARALMNWSQSDLADKAGLWHPTIANIETGKTTPSKATLDKISGVFINHGLEFLDGEGVKKKTETVLTLSGESDFERFYDLVYDAAKTTGGQIFISNVDERIFDEFVQPEFDKFHMHRMEQIRRNIDFRTLVKEGDDYLPAKGYSKYKWLAADKFANTPFYVFADYLAIIIMIDEPMIILIKNQKVADLYREKFLIQWESAKKPILPERPKGKKKTA